MRPPRVSRPTAHHDATKATKVTKKNTVKKPNQKELVFSAGLNFFVNFVVFLIFVVSRGPWAVSPWLMQLRIDAKK